MYKLMSKHNLIKRITKKYLRPQNGPILEGGCGVGQFVYSLSEAGYTCVGIDIAKETIKRAQKTNPSLNLKVMDVRDLKFPDNYFAGYWSLGVIEHFFEGYDEILNEMYRVIKPGGHLFISAPTMSLLRKLKAFFGVYEIASGEIKNAFNKSDFYQFIFPHKKLINDFTKKGLELVEVRDTGGIKGLKDEVTLFKTILKFISEQRNKNIVFKSFVKSLDIVLSQVSGHMGLFVFKKR
jgi:ubiquinone/menaquinone biosynthesis C-methylase UbiE